MTSSRIDRVNFRTVWGLASILFNQTTSGVINCRRVMGSGEMVEGFEVGRHGVAAGVHQAQAAIGLDAADAGDGRGCKR